MATKESEYNRIRLKVGVKKLPTTGMTAIVFFLETVGTQKSLTITGYDFFQRVQWITKIPVQYTARSHNPEIERKFVDKLIQDGLIERI